MNERAAGVAAAVAERLAGAAPASGQASLRARQRFAEHQRIIRFAEGDRIRSFAENERMNSFAEGEGHRLR